MCKAVQFYKPCLAIAYCCLDDVTGMALIEVQVKSKTQSREYYFWNYRWQNSFSSISWETQVPCILSRWTLKLRTYLGIGRVIFGIELLFQRWLNGLIFISDQRPDFSSIEVNGYAPIDFLECWIFFQINSVLKWGNLFLYKKWNLWSGLAWFMLLKTMQGFRNQCKIIKN